MPVYEYQCEDCSCQFELKKSFKDGSKAVCPKCQGKASRIFSPVPIIFKGSGFYITDHRSDHNGGEKAPDSLAKAKD